VAYVHWLDAGGLSREHVGGKGASLSAMFDAGFPVPPGFCITADGYRHFIEGSVAGEIESILSSLDTSDRAAVGAASQRIVEMIGAASIPEDLADEVRAAYGALCDKLGENCAVRSSAVSEDGSAASFAGLYETYLNVKGADSVLEYVQRCYQSLWADRAVSYRTRRGGGADEAMAVVVMGLVPSETSGIAFTAHPVTGSLDQIVINASYGLGEAIVSGRVTPDMFVIAKGTGAVVSRDIYPKTLALYPHPDGGGVVEEELAGAKCTAPSITDEDAVAVARMAERVESHYGSPQDIEWAMAAGKLYLLQSRPITTL
jgi:phosphoenolpyruvate synthase/pyruvate phosphate dikinase